MDLRSLINKLDTIAEDDARAQYDKFKADDAKSEARTAAIKLVKSRIFSKWQVPKGVTGITKEEGKIVWGDSNSRGEGGDTVTGRTMSMDMYNKGNNFVDAPLKNSLTLLGIAVGPVAEKSLFGSTEVAGVNIQQLADILLVNPVKVTVAPVSSTVDIINQSVYHIKNKHKLPLLIKLLGDDKISSLLVFTQMKHAANKLAKKLNENSIPADAIHGNKSQNARQLALENFKKGKIRVLVATDIAARGIDINELGYVLNFDLV
jgi:SNF2 family DNA or RNA helicase